MKKTKIILTRDSVCAADDLFPLHEKKWSIISNENFAYIIQKAKNEYLPKIEGGEATWLAKCKGQVIAVIAQQWDEPRMLNTNKDFESLLNGNGNLEFFFEYLCQEDPERVYERVEYKNI